MLVDQKNTVWDDGFSSMRFNLEFQVRLEFLCVGPGPSLPQSDCKVLMFYSLRVVRLGWKPSPGDHLARAHDDLPGEGAKLASSPLFVILLEVKTLIFPMVCSRNPFHTVSLGLEYAVQHTKKPPP